ncbi:MAG: MalY/PatB family protein [Fusobacterium sp. JB021]|nr:MalY/PatB family protein [Fusobacterium sp. JB020]MDP0493895.1 MalY/PatB family protein [Fusobacterium sp. JB021]MDP0506154.1 MalY/PatB family protein [Fusobacterium sp. JB019]
MNNFNKIVDRKETNSVKWDFVNFMYPKLDHDVLPLWVADMDFQCSSEITKALNKRVNHKIFGYSYFDQEYYNIVKEWFKENYSYEIKEKEINYSPGVVPAIGILIDILTEKGDGVIIQPPVYGPFKGAILSHDRKVIKNHLINDDDSYYINFKDLERKVKNPNNKLLILCSPHNPVGRVWTKEELEKIVEICDENNIYIIADEIHCDLIRSNVKFTSMGTLKKRIQNKLIICTSPSKSFNLAGLQLSNIIIFSNKIKKKWTDEIVKKMHLGLPSPFAITATKAAYSKSKPWLIKVNKYIDDNFKFLEDYLNEHLPKVKYIIPEGTYLAWLNFSEYDLSDEEINDRMINKGKVAFNKGTLFGRDGKKYQRINVACSREILKEALIRIELALEK